MAERRTAGIATRVRAIGLGRLFVGIVGIVVLFGPGVAWVMGSRAGMIENRPFAARPTLSQRFHMGDQATAFFTDRLPIREDAVRVRREVSERLFDEAPQAMATEGPIGAGSGAGTGTQYEQSRSLQIIEGSDGWLYYGDDFVRACRPKQTMAESIVQLRRLAEALTAAGKNTVITIVPDKSGIERENLPKDLPERSCAQKEQQRRIDALRADAPPEYLDMVAVFQRLRAKLGKPIYVPIDSHTTTRGAAEFVHAVVDRLDPKVAASAKLVKRAEPMIYPGDLSVMAGTPEQVSEPTLAYQRAGIRRRPPVRTEPLPRYGLTRQRATGSADYPVIPGKTLWYGDSFTQRSLTNIGAFFQDITRIPEFSRQAAQDDLPAAVRVFVDQVRQAKTVVIEQTEREVLGRMVGSILNPPVVDQIVAALQQDPGVR